jgi:hypothetical protein
LPERAAVIGSLERGDAIPDWARAHLWTPIDPVRLVRALDALAEREAAIGERGTRERATTDVADTLVVERAICRLATTPGPGPTAAFWSQPVQPLDGTTVVTDPPAGPAHLARLLCAAQLSRFDRADRTAAVLTAFRSARTCGQDGCRIDIEIDDGGATVSQLRTEVPPSALAIALTGLVTETSSSQAADTPAWSSSARLVDPDLVDGCLRFTVTIATPARAWRTIDPRVLNTAVAGRVHRLQACGRGEVAVPVTGTTRTVLVDASGAVRDGWTWPEAIVGDIAFEEGRLAWSFGATSALFLRAGGRTRRWDVPFSANAALACADGSVVFATSQGAWRWRPEHAPVCLLPGAFFAAHAVEDGIRFDPFVKKDGRRVRTRQGRAAVLGRDGAQRWTPLAASGPCWSSAAAPGGTHAEGYPHADLVRLTSATGESREMVCYYPVSVAWAGSSLLVATMAGDLLSFEGLLP